MKSAAIAIWGWAAATGVVLERWEVTGDPPFDPRDTVSALPWAPGDTLAPGAPDSAAALLRTRLVESGWWDSRVVPSTDGGVVRLDVAAGEPTVVGEIDLRGNTLLSRQEIFSRMDLREGRRFDAATLRADVARVLRAYSEIGRPLARIYPSSFVRSADGKLSFRLRIGEGPRGEIEFVRVFGSTATEDGVVARIGGVRPGDTWNARRVDRMATRIRREGLFLSVTEPRVVRGSRDNLLGIELEVEEGPSGSFFGVLGYNPDPSGGGELVGQVDLRLRNILGTARRASLRYERLAKEVRDVAFRYREPWFLGTPVSLELGAAQALRDTLYSRTDVDVTLSVPVGDRSTARVAAERRRSSFDDVLGQDVSETQTGGSVSLDYDARDRTINPSRGWYGALLVGSRRTEEDVRRSRLEADGQWLAPLGRRWVLSERAGFRGIGATRGDVPLYDHYYLGGTNTVRGYREEQFHGERVWWTRSELRYRLSIRSRAYAFADVGGFDLEPSGDASGDRDVLPGGGVGLAMETRSSGIVRIELALGRGDGFSDAKVHAGLEQEF